MGRKPVRHLLRVTYKAKGSVRACVSLRELGSLLFTQFTGSHLTLYSVSKNVISFGAESTLLLTLLFTRPRKSQVHLLLSNRTSLFCCWDSSTFRFMEEGQSESASVVFPSEKFG